MLVLTRRIDETIIVNDNIRITVLKNNRGAVSLGIEAPRDVTVWREEIWKKLQREKVHVTPAV